MTSRRSSSQNVVAKRRSRVGPQAEMDQLSDFDRCMG
eukprot:CAMPEP_0115028078 /NCGR_PEP_ID=MMETSP0216-20121206/36007_1 /TAXON_ID=223996 /ORGANISM="Protocruzia adherens, Strain Boccale" /LENGTH=36 /DNA_ID= /DNA_START= /DNA_END= /DNA_ORIENTATION=